MRFRKRYGRSDLDELTFEDTIKGDNGIDTLAVVGSAANFSMWNPNSLESKSFDAISLFDTLSFGTANSSYTIAGTKTIELSNKVQTTGILHIDASHASGGGDDVLALSAFQFSSSRWLPIRTGDVLATPKCSVHAQFACSSRVYLY